MVKRNPHLAKLHSSYLFPEIQKRKISFLKNNPDAQLINLGIGDTTQPIPEFITQALIEKATSLGTLDGYSGYGSEQGREDLRKLISTEIYQNRVSYDEIFISDGSKCDIGRLQFLFGSQMTMAVQNPSYPAFVDNTVIIGQSGPYIDNHYNGIVYMPCQAENNFFPDFSKIPRTDLIYFCSPNNPTGAAATRDQLEELVAFAKHNQSIIVFDAAYALYIQDQSLPRSIFEIQGAEDVAIELSSFSKMAGFTGLRLGWSVVPKSMKFDDGTPVINDWHRVVSTTFNGASNIAQSGGVAALQPSGLNEMKRLVSYYLHNASLLKNAFDSLGYSTCGGIQSPFIWIKVPKRTSWEAFEELLEKAHIISIPGSGFGSAGEGYIRLSAFGQNHHVEEAITRLTKLYHLEQK